MRRRHVQLTLHLCTTKDATDWTNDDAHPNHTLNGLIPKRPATRPTRCHTFELDVRRPREVNSEVRGQRSSNEVNQKSHQNHRKYF